jgi:hyperosmotically inducible protein
MNTKPGLTAYSATLAGVMALLMTGCDKPVVATGTPVPSTTVGTEIDDSVLTTRVKTALLEEVNIKSFDLKVETHKGEVMLSGFVDNQYQLDRALSVTRGVAGVKSVDNKVSLKSGATTVGTKVDDSITTTRVKTALLADESIKSLDIMVVTRNAEVQLSGFVNSQNQIDRAMTVARGIEGVSKVTNDMSIKK